MVTSISNDSAAAKQAARIVVAFYIPAMPPEQIERHGIDPDSLQPIFDAFNAGDVEKAVELTTTELTEKLSMSGSPRRVGAADQGRRDPEWLRPHDLRPDRPVPRRGLVEDARSRTSPTSRANSA